MPPVPVDKTSVHGLIAPFTGSRGGAGIPPLSGELRINFILAVTYGPAEHVRETETVCQKPNFCIGMVRSCPMVCWEYLRWKEPFGRRQRVRPRLDPG